MPTPEEQAAAEKQALIEELRAGARWCAVRKLSNTGKKKDAEWMKPNEGDPLWPDVSNKAVRWIQNNLYRFQALVTRTRKEMADDVRAQHP